MSDGILYEVIVTLGKQTVYIVIHLYLIQSIKKRTVWTQGYHGFEEKNDLNVFI